MNNLSYNPFQQLYYDFRIDYERIHRQIRINFLFGLPENKIQDYQFR
jgi:hypothetical protein